LVKNANTNSKADVNSDGEQVSSDSEDENQESNKIRRFEAFDEVAKNHGSLSDAAKVCGINSHSFQNFLFIDKKLSWLGFAGKNGGSDCCNTERSSSNSSRNGRESCALHCNPGLYYLPSFFYLGLTLALS
jgi:hypothetical protein